MAARSKRPASTKQIRIKVQALNIKTDPHPPGTYEGIFDRAAKQKLAVPYWGKSNYGMIGDFYPLPEKPDRPSAYAGTIHLYTHIDQSLPWFNIEKAKQADDRETGAIQIPKNLKPEYHNAEFIFFPKNHRLVFETRLISAVSLRTLLDRLLNHSKVRPAGIVEVTVEQTTEGLNEILNLKRIDTLEIVITRPNPDDLSGFDEAIRNQMKQQKAAKLTTTLTAEQGKGLNPDQNTKNLATLALSDGHVAAKGRDMSGASTKVSTANFPLEERSQYDPSVSDYTTALRLVAESALFRVLDKVRGIRGKP